MREPRWGLVLASLAGALLVMWLFAPSVGALGATYTPYHKGTNLYCSDCHAMHGGVTAARGTIPTYTGVVSALLLKGSGKNTVCLGCHDGSATAAPQVLSLNLATAKTAVRSAGYQGATDSGYGHAYGATRAAPGSPSTGFTPSTGGLLCIDCHNNHPGASAQATYRNLKPTPGHGGNNASGTSSTVQAILGTLDTDLTTSMSVRISVTTHPNWTTNGDAYLSSNIYYYVNDGTSPYNFYSQWCATCHSGFATSAATGSNTKHPTGGTMGVIGGTSSSTVSSLSTLTRPGLTRGSPTSNLRVVCGTCHRAHGTANYYGLQQFISADAGGTNQAKESGTGGIKDLCGQCHSAGS